MEKNDFIEQIKKMIDVKVKSLDENVVLSPSYIDNLFSQIKSEISIISPILGLPSIDDISLKSYFDSAKKEYLSLNPIDIDPISSLNKKDNESWLTSTRAKIIGWNYTERYLRHLEKTGRSQAIIDETKQSSLEIMGKLGDPSSKEAFYIKGLVVGEVQSGKTGNFNAVINRAVDCGYELIIVLSGIMDDLRIQTQQRIESDVIGEGVSDNDSQKKGAKGVGKITRFGRRRGSNIEQVNSITSVKSDFKKSLADADFSLEPINILVCKKNVGVLKNLIIWLHDYLDQDKEKHNISFLIIDDEADNASLNNEGAKGKEYASKINGHIRALLQLFHKKSYLGYTATPFANVLQDRNLQPEKEWKIQYKLKGEKQEKSLSQVDNIFPDDFICLLNPPSNYVGAKQIFETTSVIENKAEGLKIPLIEPIDDYVSEFPSRVFDSEDPYGVTHYANKKEWEDKSGSLADSYFSSYSEYSANTRASKAFDDFPKKLPESLKEAVICFILSVAIREKRKPEMMHSALYQPHHTMLVHISRFTLWQNKTSMLVDAYLSQISLALLNDNPSASNSIYFEVEKIWYKYYATIVESIRSYLPPKYVDEFMTPMVFDSVKKHLPEAVKDIEVKAINSITKYKLEYLKSKPTKIIAIGGNRLSRGFTLEGLTVNYFIRNTNYSDTLLQMGRWFGYRPGYLDCCKLFTTYESIDKFNATTKCIEELEQEFKKMARLPPPLSSPSKFVLRVKKHPGTLKITRPSILKKTVDVKWSYQDQLEMTTLFDISKQKMELVWNTFKSYTAPKLIQDPDLPKGFLSYKATGKEVIELLQKENNFSLDDVDTMTRFIELCNAKQMLLNWSVVLKTTGSATSIAGKGLLAPSESGLMEKVNLSIRRGPKEKSIYRDEFIDRHQFRATGKNANIISSSKDLSIRLSQSTIQQAENIFHDEKTQEIQKRDPSISREAARKTIKTIPERVYREKMGEDEAVLIIYLFDSHYSFNCEKGKDEDLEFVKYVKDNDINLDIPLVGYAIGFPPIENDPGGIYTRGDYDIKEDEPFDEEYSNEDSPLPSDNNEVNN